MYGNRTLARMARRTGATCLCLLWPAVAWGVVSVDLTRAVVVAGQGASVPAGVLVEEANARRGLSWSMAAAPASQMPRIEIRVDPASGLPSEGYRIEVEERPGVVVTVVGATRRGALYGAGYLLRKMTGPRGSAALEARQVETAPRYSVRGHQLGYRGTANSWDAWSPEQFDQYIRELALFGVNAIEGIPAESDDTSPLMRYSRPDMNRAISGICEMYGLDYWIWLPAPDDVSVEAAARQAMADASALFQATPSIGDVFVPGGDPGESHPRDLIPFLRELADSLHKYHPEAGLWTSLQKFDQEKTDYFLGYLAEHEPTWLRGIVDGPWAPPLQTIRARIPERYAVRAYPDITHNVRCQFHVPWWDPVLAYTLGREAPNPRPRHFSLIFGAISPLTDGFVTYSDGVHDDVNKAVWSALGWDPDADVREILRDYCRLYFSPGVADRAADGILALESNWRGPVRTNGGIEATLDLWESLDRDAPELRTNWRWQLCQVRAAYDAYARGRYICEMELEDEANASLAEAAMIGSGTAMDRALAALGRAESEPTRPELRQRIVDLCEALNQSIALQTSVQRYGAKNAERGAILDFIDLPLNNRWWLDDEFARIRRMPSEAERLARLEVIRTWENPGEGSFYDDIGNVEQSRHVLRGEPIETDPTFAFTPVPFYLKFDGGFTRKRSSWQTNVHWPVGMLYTGLDPAGEYTVRVTGQGRLVMRIDGEVVTSDNESASVGEFRTYRVPASALDDGTLRLTWDDVDAGNVHWRQYSRLAEVWLLKR